MPSENKPDKLEKLEIEGINSQGFGFIPKSVMTDVYLSIEAKTIYAYFCSFAGKGNTCFPSRDTILRELDINKSTYYKHLEQLLSQNYISIKRQGPNKAGSNIYTLLSNPKKSRETPLKKKPSMIYGRVKISGIKKDGYGIIPQMIMRSELPIKSKGLYAYFCSFTGSGESAFPEIKTMLYHLNITENTYYKYFNILINDEYIFTKQRYVEGRKYVNDYYVNDKLNPKELKSLKNDINTEVVKYLEDLSLSKHDNNQPLKNRTSIKKSTLKNWDIGKKPTLKNWDIEKGGPTLKKQDIKKWDIQKEPNTKKQDIKKQDIKKQDIKKQDIKKWDTNINSIKINSLKTNSKETNSVKKESLLINQSINQERLTDYDKIKEAFLENIHIEDLTIGAESSHPYKKVFTPEERKQRKILYDSFLHISDLVASALSKNTKEIKIGGSNVPIEEVYKKLMSLTEGHVRQVITSVQENFLHIKSPTQYILTSLFNAADIDLVLNAYKKAKF